MGELVPARQSERLQPSAKRWLIGFCLYNVIIVWPLAIYGVLRQRHHDAPTWLAITIGVSIIGYIAILLRLRSMFPSPQGATDNRDL